MSRTGAISGKREDSGASRLGWRILIPGYPQWSWRQDQRGMVLSGSYLVSLGVGLFAWGTPISVVLLTFAYGTHVASVADVIRHRAFPGFGRWVPTISASGGLGLGIYLPAMTLASLVAWPGMGTGLAREGYLVDCRAYRTTSPRPGDWVWLRSTPWDQRRIGRTMAGPGQEVEWSGGVVRVDTRPASPSLSPTPVGGPRTLPVDMVFTVPPGHALIAPMDLGLPRTLADGPVLVPEVQILGRAWARLYPIRARQFLPANP